MLRRPLLPPSSPVFHHLLPSLYRAGGRCRSFVTPRCRYSGSLVFFLPSVCVVPLPQPPHSSAAVVCVVLVQKRCCCCRCPTCPPSLVAAVDRPPMLLLLCRASLYKVCPSCWRAIAAAAAKGTMAVQKSNRIFFNVRSCVWV